MNNRQTGNAGEEMACAYIKDLGMEVLERNWHFGHEEIDIIARDGDTTVFIEVKYRLDDKLGLAQEAVTRKKQASIVRTAVGSMQSYWLLVLCLGFLIFYAVWGSKNVNKDIPVND